jgi:hypothetical protein
MSTDLAPPPRPARPRPAAARPPHARRARSACWLVLAAASCVRGEGGRTDSAAGEASLGFPRAVPAVARDTALAATAAATPAAGPAAQVTKTDTRSVVDAGSYRLTADNFARYMRASDALLRLEQRDPRARAFLEQNVTGAGSADADAGLRRLESQPAVRRTIEGAGLSVRDYFVMSIAIASAARFVDNPGAAPATPATRENAEFLRAHRAELDRLNLEQRQR